MSFAKSCFSQDLNGDISNLIELSIIAQRRDFDDQIEACLDAGKTLARIDTLELFQFTSSYCQEVGVNQDVWIGVAQPGTLPASTAFFVDGNSDNVAFFQEDGVLPWLPGQPDLGREECIEIRPPNFFWNDEDCPNDNPGLCRGQCVIEDIVAEASISSCFVNEDGVGQDEFILIDELVNFNALNVICEQSFDAKPARIQNFEELSEANLFFQEKGIETAFIGVVRIPDIDVNGPSAFQFFDGVQENLDFFQVDFGELPWGSNEPNNTGNCVQLSASNGLWSAVSCDSATIGLCRRTCSIPTPTTAPTENPTSLLTPTDNPTGDSFLEESISPTLATTNTPTSDLNSPTEDDINGTSAGNEVEENLFPDEIFLLVILFLVILILLSVILFLTKYTQLRKVKKKLTFINME